MIVRTYGRRSREDDELLPGNPSGGGSFSLSQENPSQDFYDYPFSSQESSSFWPSSTSSSPDLDPFAFNPPSSEENPPADGCGIRKSKKPRNGKLEKQKEQPWVPLTSTLMEAQELGEMMEYVDEVDFAVDGLRRGQPVRIRRSSLVSLLSICGTAQQRRILRAQGTVKTIMDAVLGLSFDDGPSNLAAATLLYVLTSDGQDDRMLESPSCIRFLLKLLKPVLSVDNEDKAQNLGSKLLGIGRNLKISHDTSKMPDPSSSPVIAKVEEILMNCKGINSQCGLIKGIEKPESTSKFIALLAMEKACLSKISLEDTSGMARKMDGNFKEELRELGGLDAVFEVALNCHSVIEGAKDAVVLPSLVMLLKCLKIMENSTFMSKQNQDHLLTMKRHSDSHGCRISFTKLVVSVIKLLSGLYLRTTAASTEGKPCISTAEGIFSERDSQTSSKSTARLVLSASREASMDDNDEVKSRSRSSMFSSSSKTLRSCNGSVSASSNGSRSKYDSANDDSMCELFDSQDPFAFDEDDFEPSKWDKLYSKPKKSRTPAMREPVKLETTRESSTPESCIQNQSDGGSISSVKDSDSNSNVSGEECSTLVNECLLTAVKVLMNLTNENPVGCRQVAACRGLEAMSSLIADHFPSFDSSSSLCNKMKEENSRLTDQELDFLVAILGLLVNLVEKDGQNRSRLASASVSLANSQGSEDETRIDVIPLLCSIFLAHRGEADQPEQGNCIQWDDETAMLEGEKEAEKMIVEAYAALLLAFLSTESKGTRESIANCLPDRHVSCLVPVLERFVAFHLTLNMISPETHEVVKDVIRSCRLP